ncbi:BEN domain containing protein 6 [Dissostichus eleginoides]|uniref:BEN domain containing protein 6 n=1 Tax=Dissostichus eleginoides TaxID=100907 RepID=A0AAD9B5R1_DISEL|nr:BEN domain containing protein 6 [Dissostichus eleginoides]
MATFEVVLFEGKEPFEQSGPMGKGKRAKKRRPFLEEDDDVEQSEERPSKKSRPESSSSTDIIKKYKDLQKAQEVNEKSYLRTLEERVAALERENYSLRNALSIIEERKPEEEGTSTAHTSTAGPSLQSSTTHLPLEDVGISTDAVCLDIKQAIKDRCNKATAAKYTNDLMHGLYTTAFMAAHSVTGLGASSRGRHDHPFLLLNSKRLFVKLNLSSKRRQRRRSRATYARNSPIRRRSSKGKHLKKKSICSATLGHYVFSCNIVCSVV